MAKDLTIDLVLQDYNLVFAFSLFKRKVRLNKYGCWYRILKVHDLYLNIQRKSPHYIASYSRTVRMEEVSKLLEIRSPKVIWERGVEKEIERLKKNHEEIL